MVGKWCIRMRVFILGTLVREGLSNKVTFLVMPLLSSPVFKVLVIHFCTSHSTSHFFFKILFIYLFIYLFMAVLGLRFCVRAFSSCGKWGPLFIALRGPLTIAASLVAEHRLQTRRLSSCGPQAQSLRGMWDPQSRARTRVPCISRQTLNHCATREARKGRFLTYCSASCLFYLIMYLGSLSK